MERNGAGKICMNEIKVFFDSNVLVYVIDDRWPDKQKIAIDLVKKSINAGNGNISTQSLQEFYNVATKKLSCSKENAKNYVENFSKVFDVEQVSVNHILKAVDISIKTQFSFWDSLILAAASQSGCLVLYSEDLNDSQIVDGVKIVNPFTSTQGL